jgi:biopolymer transport protein ExbD
MQFYQPRKRQPIVPIIAMIDILTILLIFFIATTVFKEPRPILRIELPTVREVATSTTVESRSVLAVAADGKVTLDALSVPDGFLEQYLAAFIKENPGRKLELEADRNLTVEALLKVWDALTKAGIEIKDVPARIRLPGAG